MFQMKLRDELSGNVFYLEKEDFQDLMLSYNKLKQEEANGYHFVYLDLWSTFKCGELVFNKITGQIHIVINQEEGTVYLYPTDDEYKASLMKNGYMPYKKIIWQARDLVLLGQVPGYCCGLSGNSNASIPMFD